MLSRSRDPSEVCADRELIQRLRRNRRYAGLLRAMRDQTVYSTCGRPIYSRIARKLRCSASEVAMLLADARCVLLTAGGGR